MAGLEPLAQSVAKANGWDETTRAMMLASKSLNTLDAALRNDDTRVRGCESAVWLAQNDVAPFDFKAYSDSKIIRGVLAVLLEKANLLSRHERQVFDFDAYLRQAGLHRHLSESRANGITEVIKRIQQLSVER